MGSGRVEQVDYLQGRVLELEGIERELRQKISASEARAAARAAALRAVLDCVGNATLSTTGLRVVIEEALR